MRTNILIASLFVLSVCEVGSRTSNAIVSLSGDAQAVRSGEANANLIQASDVSLETPTGTLFGTLMLPAGKPPFPVVLLIAGSGMTDRDGNSAGAGKSDSLKLLAAGLAQNGIATLRYDKRSVGMSAPARAKINSFDIQADDAASWVAWLGNDSRYRAVAIVGHSEGAFVGTIAAQRGGVRALVSLAGGGHRFDEVLAGQMERAVHAGQLSQKAFESMRGVLAELREGRPVTTRQPNIPDQLWIGLFQPRAQEYLISLFRYDPVAELAKLPSKGVQVMVVRGTTDLMGGADEAILLAKAIGAKPVLIDGMNHELKSAPLERVANDKASEDPRVPLAPELLKQVVPFLTSALK